MITRPISVIIPNKNGSIFLKSVFDSLSAQTEMADEVLFVDDQSTDDSLSRIEALKGILQHLGGHTQVLSTKNKRTSGPGAARNVGLEVARNDIVCFLDVDDFWRPEKISEVWKAFSLHPEINLVSHDELMVINNTESRYLRHICVLDNKGHSISRSLYRNNFLSTSAVSLRRSGYPDGIIKFDESLPNGQDYDLWLKISPFVKIHHIPQALGVYEIHQTSITKRSYWRRIFSNARICIKHRRKDPYWFPIKLLRTFITRQWFDG